MSLSAVSRRPHFCIAGQQFKRDRFPFLEFEQFDPKGIVRVLDGQAAGVIFRKFLSTQDCAKIAENFWAHPSRYARAKDAPAEYVGTYHYRKPLDRYFSEVDRFASTMDQLFRGLENPHAKIISALATETGATVRPAQHDGRSAGAFVMRSWNNSGDFALDPHEDEAQCRDPLQAGFEIQDAARNPLAALNLCLENGSGGRLFYWNVIPSDVDRDQLGLTITGSPYPIESLDGIERQVVQIEQGDLYCFNGKAIHAVGALAGGTGTRATIAFLMARLNQNTIVYWT